MSTNISIATQEILFFCLRVSNVQFFAFDREYIDKGPPMDYILVTLKCLAILTYTAIRVISDPNFKRRPRGREMLREFPGMVWILLRR